jgi:hypothetical protein
MKIGNVQKNRMYSKVAFIRIHHPIHILIF